jgi:hypothetical protein
VSLVVTVYVREGIVMAADSRLTLNAKEQQGDTAVVNLSVAQSDSSYKLFLTPGGLGISTCGEADIQGVPIAGYIDSFIRSDLGAGSLGVRETAQRLLDHFAAFKPVPNTQFHVAGYAKAGEDLQQEVWVVNMASSELSQANQPGQQGASWGGEGDILSRLIQPVAQLDESGAIVQAFPHHPIPWQFFTLQDAIDFAVFAVRSTIDAIRLQPRAKTVGGPIDVLVIRPDGARWIQRKELHVAG